MDDTNEQTKEDIFMPQETPDNPYNVTLVVEDDKEFKAHRKVLSEASSFFEKLLNSGMRESKEGVVRLESLNEIGLGAVLEFIYTGGVQILAEDNARDLIEMADYLFIPQLKTFAGKVLTQTLNTSNCISIYHFAERYQCEGIVSDTKNFIHANFTNVAKTVEFLNMSSDEVNKWISSDEIDVSSEEDVFKIILTWIDHDKSERTKYFADLFRQVRLVYVSRDYLSKSIVTNDLVNDHECCLKLVNDAMKAIDSKNSENILLPPLRKSLETPVIVVCIVNKEEQLLCYVPSTNTWYKLRERSIWSLQMASSHGTLYAFWEGLTQKILHRYDSLFDRRTGIPYNRKRDLRQVFVSDNNEDCIYVLETDNKTSCRECASLDSRNGSEGASECFPCGKKHLCYITKYEPESNSWEAISSVDFGLREGICIVAKDNLIYFIGGLIQGTNKALTAVDRYDLSERKWDKMAHVREARNRACGTAAYGKIFIHGGYNNRHVVKSCEVYNEGTNEWHLIASPMVHSSVLCVDKKVYVVDGVWYNQGGERGEIECYDHDKDEWNVITKIPLQAVRRCRDGFPVRSFSMRVFTGVIPQWTQIIS